ncbi:ATP-binding cassette domain-containing protein [endosymbiont GvMRE of Glomus versiforme]|uniref:ATP-binding cassette domain-containing protein n=1 Tax=endosymbiont GvMRE of Glomus versiforme TaxID=2039283 RepID=UPI001C0F0725|nr:ABC transporter ATP-binding protein [endosymbiont GvMRE of Glomus versiforme]
MNINQKNFYQKIKWKKFSLSIIKGFFFISFSLLLQTPLFDIFWDLFSSRQNELNNYAELLPPLLKKFIKNLSKQQFIFLGLTLLFFYVVFFYLSKWWEKKLIFQVSDYYKNCLLRKFHRLNLEEKIKQKEEINSLVEIENSVVGEHWVKLINSIYEGSFSFLLLIFYGSVNPKAVKDKFFPLAVLWVIVFNLVIWFFNKLSFRHGKISKKEVSKEYGLINKEINNSVLIESSGLNSQYEKDQQILTKKSQKKKVYFSGISLGGTVIPWKLIINLFPFLLLAVNKDFFIGGGMSAIWMLLNNLVYQLGYLWNYGDYKSSSSRINAFLSLPEKNDNLTGIKLTDNQPIQSIIFQNVYFHYQGQKDWVLKNYNRSFCIYKINHLTGKIGIGKSTILYLILGVIKPQKGQVIVECQDGQIYNLYQDINLRHWRENNVAYASHDNLIETGSTGQRQLANINNLFITKKQAQIFLFDEADNNLDNEKQKEFQENIKELVKQKKIVVNVKCKED